MKQSTDNMDECYLKCEKLRIYIGLIFVAGFLGAFTFLLRGGVFCNAQSANVVLLSLSVGQGNWKKALYYLIPISAYFLGAFLSECLPNPLKRFHFLRWDTVLVLNEALVLIFLGVLPDSYPVQISQVAINFICSMQYNTFRQSEHIPMATTFCTNHIRQTGIYVYKWIRHQENLEYRHRLYVHLIMLGSFFSGAVVSTFIGQIIGSKSIWFAAFLLVVIFVDLAYSDLTSEKELIVRKPSGH